MIDIRMSGGADRTGPAVLVLRALGLGDLLTAVPALRGLRRAYPRHRLVLAAPAALEPLVALTGCVDEVLPTAGLGELRWTDEAPDLAVNLHGRGPESIADLLAVAPRNLLTHRHPAYPGVPGAKWRSDLHEVDRWCRLLEFAGIAADREDLDITAPGAHGAIPTEPATAVVHPGAGSPSRRWPAERYAEVAAHLHERGLHVVVTGSAGEVGLAREVAEAAGLNDDAVHAGRHDLAGLVDVVAGTALVVCGDTGMGHLATAVGRPSVLLFGPMPPRLWGPPVTRPGHLVLWAGDVGDPHGQVPDSGLLLLTSEQVIMAVDRQLARYPADREVTGVG